MREIDIETWDRREHFEFFRRADLPFYAVDTAVDVTGLREFAKARGLSLNTLLIHLTVRAANAVENLRYRSRDGNVVLHDGLHPSFAHLRSGEALFRLITVDFAEDPVEFDRVVRDAIATSGAYFDLTKLRGRDDFVFISSLPWISFTGLSHTMSLRKDDATPRMSWGKIFPRDGREMLPYNIQVNHVFVDGIHISKFLDSIDNCINELIFMS